jgi:hypothetical protein
MCSLRRDRLKSDLFDDYLGFRGVWVLHRLSTPGFGGISMIAITQNT